MVPSSRPVEASLAPIEGALRRIRLRLRARRALSGMALTAAVALPIFAASLLADRCLFLPSEARRLLTWGCASTAAICALISFARTLAPISPIALAWRAERRYSRLGESLVTAVEVGGLPRQERERYSSELVDALLSETGSRMHSVDPRAIAPLRRPAAAVAFALGLWAACGAILAADLFSTRALAWRFLFPASDLPRPSTAVLDVRPGDAVLGRGEDLLIVAKVLRGDPRSAILRWRGKGEDWRDGPMAPASLEGSGPAGGPSPSAFEKRLPALRAPLDYLVRSGDFESRAFRVTVLAPPRPLTFRVEYVYPAYTARGSETSEQQSGDLAGVRGTRVAMEVTATGPLQRARIEGFPSGAGGSPEAEGGPLEVALDVSGPRARIAELPLETSGSYRLYLESPEGVSNRSRDGYAVRVLADRPPEAEILEPLGEEVTVDRSGFVEIRYEGRDDLGVRALDLLVEVEGSPTALSLWPPAVGAAAGGERTRIAGTYILDLRRIDPAPGKPVVLRLRGRDGLGQEGLSASRTLRAADVPAPPEGPGWPAPLARVHAALASAVESWPEDGLAGKGPKAPDAARLGGRGGELPRWAAWALGLREAVSGTGDAATRAGAAIAVPSLLRGALEDLGASLRETAELELLDVFAAASEGGAGLAKASARARSRLVAAERAAGALLEAEDMEEILESALALAWESRQVLSTMEKTTDGGVGGGASLETLHARLGDMFAASATLTGRISRRPRAAGAAAVARWEPLAVGLLESTIAEIDAARDAAVGAVGSIERASAALERAASSLTLLASRLEDRRMPRRGEARAAIRALSRRGRVASLLEGLADALRAPSERAPPESRDAVPEGAAPPAEVGSLRAAIVASREELARIEGAKELDGTSRSEVASLIAILESLAEEALETGAAASRGERLAVVEETIRAWSATAPSRVLGHAAVSLRDAGEGEAEVAWRLRQARTASFGVLRHLLRSQREIEDLVASVRGALEEISAQGDATRGPVEAELGRALAAEIRLLAEAERISAEALVPLESPAGAILRGNAGAAAGLPPQPGAEAFGKASDALASASRAMESASRRLEEIRGKLLPAALSARLWLRAEAGMVSEKVARVAVREREVGVRAQAPSGTEDLLLVSEGLREETRRIARELLRDPGSAASSDGIGTRDRISSGLEAVAGGPMLAASRGLRDALGAGRDVQPGMLLEASRAATAAAEELEGLAAALRELETAEAAGLATTELEEILRAVEGAPPDCGDLEAAELAKIARALRERTIRASEALSARMGAGPRLAALTFLLAEAAGLFKGAAAAGEAGDAAGALSAIEEGCGRLEEAAALGTRTRADAERELARLRRGTGEKDEGAARSEEAATPEAGRVEEDVQTLLELERLEAEIARLFDAILDEPSPDAAAVAEIVELAKRVEEEIAENVVSTEELVELVAALVRVDREGGDLARRERALAAEAEAARDRPPGAARSDAPALRSSAERRAEQEELVERARSLVGGFHRAGLELSALLPLIFRAYWQGQDAAERMVEAMGNAARVLAETEGTDGAAIGPPASETLLEAGARIDAFLSAVGEMRREALEAIADAERGFGEANAAHLSMERAQRELTEARRLLERGDTRGASLAQAASRRSIADARGALAERRRLGAAGAEPGISVETRLLRETARERGADWQVLARGEDPGGALRSALAAPDAMPFPAVFRDLVRLYLRALGTGFPTR